MGGNSRRGVVRLAALPDDGSLLAMTMSQNPYRGFRFPAEVIQHAVGLRLPRFGGRLVGLRSYVLVMAACLSVSKDIGERYPKPECSRTGL